MIIPVILAGGSGTRLWPLSRALYPKQLIALASEKSMLQATLQRLQGLENIAPPLVICNQEHRFMVAEQLRAMDQADGQILLEPVGRNTAPAVAVAALRALSDPTEDPVLLVLPADHVIADVAAFHRVLHQGEQMAAKGHLITFGIVPEAPETGYGYIRMGAALDGTAVAIEKFVEKPDLETARQYLASQRYCWNSGMFMFQAEKVVEELDRWAPEIVHACRQALEKGQQDLDFFRLDPASFEPCPSDSIDYAIMEKTDRGAMIPFQGGWNDLGSWEALWQVGRQDEDRNVCKGDVLTHDVNGCLLHATDRMIAAVGLRDFIVVETADAVMIAPRNRVQEIKAIVSQLKGANRPEAVCHRKDYRPWGSCERLCAASSFQVNRICVKPGQAFSLQKHFHRAEHWIVVRGTARVTRADEQFLLKEDESTYIPEGVTHRLENPGKIDLDIIEVQTGRYLGPDDIVRLDDCYGRRQSQ